MDKFLERDKPPKLTNEEAENINGSLSGFFIEVREWSLRNNSWIYWFRDPSYDELGFIQEKQSLFNIWKSINISYQKGKKDHLNRQKNIWQNSTCLHNKHTQQTMVSRKRPQNDKG